MSSKLSEEQLDQLESWIGTGPKTFTLLYSITRDGCAAETFHQKCDNVGPTVTVMYNPHGSIYGGYTSVSWQAGHPRWKWLPDDNAFLFQLQFSRNKKFNTFPFTKGPDFAIHPLASNGPTFGFGNGNNMCTFTETVKASNGVFALNGHLKDGIFSNSKNSQAMTATDVNNGTMNVTELEVYMVTDSQRVKQYTSTKLSRRSWRKVPELNKKHVDQLKEEIKNSKPMTDVGISEFRILMLGPVGSGKSSFYNTIDSIFKGRISHRAACGSGLHSTTTKLTPYRIGTMSGKQLQFQLCDTPGFLDTFDQDVLDYIFSLDGHIPDFYKFSTGAAMTALSPEFVQKPDLNKRAHCVAFVIDGASVDKMSDQMLHKIKFLRKAIGQRDIPMAFVITKVDKVDKALENAPRDEFTSHEVLKIVEKTSAAFGVPRNSVYPVKNYEHEVHLDDQVSALALMALQQLLYLAEDYTEYLAATGATSRTS